VIREIVRGLLGGHYKSISEPIAGECALNMISNTAPFDITHHPAMAVPCGMSEGLPVSLMLVGQHFDEPTIYKAAVAYERRGLEEDVAAASRARSSAPAGGRGGAPAAPALRSAAPRR
jgi:hypothetical protein